MVQKVQNRDCVRILFSVDITLSINDATFKEAQRRAEALGTSVEQLMREYLAEFACGNAAAEGAAREFATLSGNSAGASRGWKFNRAELHERRG